MFFRGKGWVSPRLLKRLKFEKLAEIQMFCQENSVLKDDEEQPETESKEYREAARKIKKLGKAVLHEVTKRDVETSKFLESMKDIPLNEILENHRISQFFLAYVNHEKELSEELHPDNKKIEEGIRELQTKGLKEINAESILKLLEQEGVDEDKVVEGFIEYLAERETEENFTTLEHFELRIGCHQLLGKEKLASRWERRMEDFLVQAVALYKGQCAAKEFFEENPKLYEEYESFKMQYSAQTGQSGEVEDEYPLYDEFLKNLAEKRVKGEISESASQVLQEGIEHLKGEFRFEGHARAYKVLKGLQSSEDDSIRNTERKQYKYITALVEDDSFQKAAALFIKDIANDDSKDVKEFLDRFGDRFGDLKEGFDSKILKERGVKPPDDYPRDFTSALYLAAGVGIMDSDIQIFKERIEALEKTASGMGNASGFISRFEIAIKIIDNAASYVYE